MNKVIGVKTDCPHFINVGNVCSRIDGMARCDEYSECEFKYIDALKEENRQMKEKLGKIKSICEEAPAIDTELSLRIMEVLKDEY